MCASKEHHNATRNLYTVVVTPTRPRTPNRESGIATCPRVSIHLAPRSSPAHTITNQHQHHQISINDTYKRLKQESRKKHDTRE